MEKFILIPQVEGKDTNKEVSADCIHETLKVFPQDPKHVSNAERMPPCKTSTEGNRSNFAVYEFPVAVPSAAKQEHKDLVEKITTNIMDENIVR